MKTESPNVISLPVIDKKIVAYETLEANLAMANTRVCQAISKRKAIVSEMLPIAREYEIKNLAARGIILGKTVVVVVPRDDDYCKAIDQGWTRKRVFVMDVSVSHYSGWDSEDCRISVTHDFALVKKDGKPSKASTGFYSRVEIVRIATESDNF